MVTNTYNTTRFQPDRKREMVWSIFARHLQSKFFIEGSVLDVGCGYGSFINNIQADKRHAMDINPEMKEFMQPGVHFESGKTSELRTHFKQGQFDFIFSSNLIEHLQRSEIDTFFTDVKYLLKPTGSFVILMPNYRLASNVYYDDFTHITPVSDRSLSDWLQSFGFKIDFLHPGYMPYSVKDSKLPITPFLIKLWLFSFFKPGGKQMLIHATV